jgi:hypothetical protein
MTSNRVFSTWRTALVVLVIVGQSAIAHAAVVPVRHAASDDASLPGYYVAYWDRNAIQEWVAVYSRGGRFFHNIGPFQGTALVATDAKRDLFVAELASSSVSAYAPGSTTPYESFALAATSDGGSMAIDGAGDVWVGLSCGGSYCSSPGSLIEYAPNGSIVKDLSGCLLGYAAIAVDRHGDVFAGGTVSVSPPNWEVAVVEYPAGATTCRPILRKGALANWGGGLAVTRKDEIVLDFNGASTSYLETLGGPAYRRVMSRTSIFDGGYYAGMLALTRRDTEVWVGDACCDLWLGQKFSIIGGGRVLHRIGAFEQNYLVSSMAAVD